jgi:hypothetical protein
MSGQAIISEPRPRRDAPEPRGGPAGQAPCELEPSSLMRLSEHGEVELPGSAMRLSEHGERMRRLAEESARADDPESALRTLTELRREIDAVARMQVGRALATGRSFGDVARALGISRQAAHRRYRKLAPAHPRRAARRLVVTEAARRIVRLARAETHAAGATAAGSHELLLAVLGTDSDAARALRSEGVTLEKARACTRRADCAGGDGDDPGCLRRVLQRAGRVALARGDGQLSPTQLLLAAIADPDPGAHRTLTALGAAPDAIRARLGADGESELNRLIRSDRREA